MGHTGQILGSIFATLSGRLPENPEGPLREETKGGAQDHFPEQRLVIEPRQIPYPTFTERYNSLKKIDPEGSVILY